jgi:hypothetical protein
MPDSPRYLADIERPMEAIMSDIFDSAVYRESARRQFRLSVMLVACMAVAAFVVGFANPISSPHNAINVDGDSTFTGRLTAMNGQ